MERNAREGFRISSAEKKILEEAATRADLDKSKLIRRAALAEARKILAEPKQIGE